jgi:hypothetical protein
MAPTRLGPSQLAQLFVQAGGDPKYARLMANLAQRESGGRPTINNAGTNRNGTTDWGLWQVNDVWRKDPVVGPLFRSGAILTPEGNAKAAAHILKVQGPTAWATYKPGVDAKFLGGFHAGAASASSSTAPAATTRTTTTTPGVDNRVARGQLVNQFLNQHGSDPLDFAMGIRALQDTPGSTITTATATPGRARTPASDSTPSKPPGRSRLLELFWQGQGGINAKNGKKVPQGFVSGHQDHVHVAAGPKTVVELGQLAQQMGLHVGENPHFGTVHPVHVANSYHYKGEAIDVSGDPARMKAFAHRVASLYGIR